MTGEIHHVRGRLRVRLEQLKRNDERARAVKNDIATARGITSVEVNVLTGSLLVYYDPKLLTADAVLATIRDRGKLRLESPRPQAGRPVLQTKITDAMLWWAVEKLLERSVPLVIGALL